MADRSAAGGVMVALVGAVALVAGVRGVYGNIWRDLTAGTGPQVSNPSTSTAGGGGAGTILGAGGTASRNLGLGGGADPASIYTPQTPNGKYVAGAGLYDHLSSIAYGAWSLAAGAINEGARLLTSYNAGRDVARWSYAQNSNESSWEHFDRLRHDLVKQGMSIQAASDEVLREMYAAVTAAGGDWSLTGFGPVPLAGMLHV